MNWRTSCAVVVPCLNEAASIASVVAAARAHVPTVFVVDDGSSDDTAVLAEEAGAEVVRHASRRGKGAALHSGWQHARAKGFQWALAMDGDGQHAAGDIPALLDCAERTAAELIVGNRMNNAEQMPWLRRRVNVWMSKRISALAGVPLPDSQCGFRLMNLETWAALPIKAANFEIESDMLLAFAVGGRSIRFVPIQVIYKNERSKIRPVRDTLRWFRWWNQARKLAAGKHGSAAYPGLPVPIAEQR